MLSKVGFVTGYWFCQFFPKSAMPRPTKELEGPSCKDDSLQGNYLQDFGPGRASALTNWRCGTTVDTLATVY